MREDLPGMRVDLFQFDLTVDKPAELRLESLLTPEEKARGRRFLRARDQRRFIAARGRLRRLLGRLLGLEPERVVLATAERGKPYL
ncbi:MAG: 4'-phosphopantetheinyl transferase, partial [Candidatus Eremiobacterota bacterium]